MRRLPYVATGIHDGFAVASPSSTRRPKVSRIFEAITAPYKSGPSRDWIKVKNPDSPAMIRARDHSRGWD
jgi:hypothetical protein